MELIHSGETTYLQDISIDLIVPGGFNPRKTFDQTYITELAKSLKRDGQWDPIIVRKNVNGKYELIAGECRLKAAQLAGLNSLKAKILDTNDEEALLLALKTNIIRHNLNPVEEANALKKLLNTKKSLKELIKELNKSTTWIYSRLKLAEYASDGVKNAVLKEELPLNTAIKISELSEGFQGSVASKAIKERLNLNEVEKLVELFKKDISHVEAEYLLKTPFKEYTNSYPYKGAIRTTPRPKKEPTIMRCDCGHFYIIDWSSCRIVSEKKVINNEHNNNDEYNQKILK